MGGPGHQGRDGGLNLRTAVSLLKTPTSQLAVNGGSQHPDKRKIGGHGPTLADEVEHLLPTPRATDGTKGGPNQRGSSGDLMLPSAVMLLPTPRAQNGEERNQTIWGRNAVEPQNLENALAFVLEPKPGVPTSPPSTGGSAASGARRPRRPNRARRGSIASQLPLWNG